MTFDNKFSYLRAKTLEYNLVLTTVRTADDEEIKQLAEQEFSSLQEEISAGDEEFLKEIGAMKEQADVSELEAELGVEKE